MKNHRLTLLALLLICGTACQQKEILPEEPLLPEPEQQVVITASFANPTTRISYTEDEETHKLHQEWEEGDMLFGFDDSYNPLTLQVTAVDQETGVATLETVDCDLPLSGAIHMIYSADRQRDNGSLLFEDDIPYAVNIGFQAAAAGTTVPAILTADATVSNSEVHLVFENQTAILGIKGFKGLPANEVVESFFVDGVNNYATISFAEGKIALTPEVNQYLPNSVFIDKTGGWTADETGAVNETFYVAVFPNTQDSEIQLRAYDSQDTEYINKLGSKSIAAGKYYYMKNKVLAAPVAYVTTSFVSTPYFSFDDALAAANSSQEDCTIWLMENCSPASKVAITNTQAAITLNLYGHTLSLSESGIDLDTEGIDLTICDSSQNKGKIQGSGSLFLIDAKKGKLTISGAALYSTSSNTLLLVRGGEVFVQDASITQNCASSIVVRCLSGSLSIDHSVVEQQNASGDVLVYIYSGTPHVTFSGKSSFIHAGKTILVYVDVPSAVPCVNIDGAYFYHNSSSTSNMVYARSSGRVTLNGAWFNKTSYLQYNCTIGANRQLTKVYPTETYGGREYKSRVISNKAAYNNTREAYISYTVGEGKRLYPAKFNITYQPSTETWAFRNQANGYSTDYDADLISLFTWGYGDWSVVPDGTDFLTGKTEGQTLSPDQDWGSVMNAGPCRVPTKEEWEYLLNERTASTVNGVANARYLKCYYYQSYGLLIFPDEFSWPANAGNPPEADAINNPEDRYTTTISNTGVTALTQAGCIFLQADGYRIGDTVYKNSHLGTGANASGNYWSSTARGYNNESYFLTFYQPALWASSYSGSANTGHAVRLFFE